MDARIQTDLTNSHKAIQEKTEFSTMKYVYL